MNPCKTTTRKKIISRCGTIERSAIVLICDIVFLFMTTFQTEILCVKQSFSEDNQQSP